MDGKVEQADTLTALQKNVADSLDTALLLPLCRKAEAFSRTQEQGQCIFRKHSKHLLEWLVSKHTDVKSISDELQKRYDCLFSNEKMPIDTTTFPIAGNSKAPILLIVYVSATCPLCHYISRELYSAVTPGGALYGKVRFMAKPYGVTAANLSLYAANSLGKFWDYFLALANVNERIDPELFFHIADSLGMKKAHLKNLMENEKTVSLAQKNTAEAQTNQVTITPTVFINCVRYRSYKDPRWIIDAAEIKFETIQKTSLRH